MTKASGLGILSVASICAILYAISGFIGTVFVALFSTLGLASGGSFSPWGLRSWVLEHHKVEIIHLRGIDKRINLEYIEIEYDDLIRNKLAGGTGMKEGYWNRKVR